MVSAQGIRPGIRYTGRPGAATVATVAASDTPGHLRRYATYRCSGTNDDVQIQAAIDAVNSAGGGKVYLMEGTFNVVGASGGTYCVILKSGVSLEGAGPGATTIKATASAGTRHLLGNSATGASYISISNMTLDHNGVNLGASSGVHTVRLNQVSKVWLENLEVLNSDHHGIVTLPEDSTASPNTEYFISNIYCKNIGVSGRNGGDGVRIFYGADNAIVQNIIVDGPEHHGIHMGKGKATLDNVIVINAGDNAFQFDSEGIVANNLHGEWNNVTADLFANRPAASTAGAIFYGTNTADWWRDNGSAWNELTTANHVGGVVIETRAQGSSPSAWPTAQRSIISNLKLIFAITENETYTFNGGDGYYVDDGCVDVSLSNFAISGPFRHGIQQRADRGSISNGSVISPRQYGVTVGGTSAANCSIVGVKVSNAGQQTSNTYPSFTLRGGSSKTLVTACSSVGSQASYGLQEASTTAGNLIMGNDFSGNATAGAILTSSTTVIRNNLGYITENSGTGSITSGGTTDVITHGLDITPALEDIIITLGENPTNTPGAIWVDTIGSTTFTVNCENDPGASNLDFGWRVIS